MSETQIQQAFTAIGEVGIALTKQMDAWRRANGLPPLRAIGYVGRRSGWYPERPKRHRK